MSSSIDSANQENKASDDKAEKSLELVVPEKKVSFLQRLLGTKEEQPNRCLLANLQDENFPKVVREWLDSYLHFGVGGNSSVIAFWSFGSREKDRRAYRLEDLNNRERGFALSKFPHSTLEEEMKRDGWEPAESNEIWSIEPRDSDGSLVFSRIYRASTQSNLSGDIFYHFTDRRMDPEDLWPKGINISPNKVDESEIMQVWRRRLVPCFGKENAFIVPMRNGKDIALEDIGESERFQDFKIRVELNSTNIEKFMGAISAFKETGKFPEDQGALSV